MRHEPDDIAATRLQLLFEANKPSTHCTSEHQESRSTPAYTTSDRHNNNYSNSYGNTPDNFHGNCHARARYRWWLFFHDKYELVFLILVLVNAIPLVLLASYTPTLAKRLASYSCLPNGDFVLPGTASLWDKKLFFSIDILVSKEGGWDFTRAKVIDIAWDAIVGRGGQVLLTYIAYRVFHKALVHVMVERPVGFQTYSAVAFDTGKISFLWTFLRSLTSRTFPLTFHGYRVFTAMLLCTAYIVSVPTLLSAMTGYVVTSSPSIEMPPTLNLEGDPPGPERDWDCARQGNCSVTPCQSLSWPAGLLAAWGTVHDRNRNSSLQFLPIPVYMEDKDISPVVAYYKRYKVDYDAAAKNPRCQNTTTGLNATMLTDCASLNKTSEIEIASPGNRSSSLVIHLDAPMLNIEVWPVDEVTNIPSAWLCSGLTVKTADISSQRNVTGICTAVDTNYQWGFSYLILLFVCIMHLLFAIIVYTLWLEANRYDVAAAIVLRETAWHRNADADDCETYDPVRKAAARPSILTSAIAIVGQAEQHYGAKVGMLTSHKLRKRVWGGNKGMQVGSREDTEA